MNTSPNSSREVSAAAHSMPRSGIREIMDIAWGVPDVIHLEVGEPNFPTPDHVVEAAINALHAGATRYTPNAGIFQLREAISAKVRDRNGIEAPPERIVVTSGGVEALYSTMLSLLEKGDGILLPDPGWPNFRMMATLLGAEVQPYSLRAEDEYQPQVEVVERAITDRTKVLLINTPSNPLGTVLSRNRARELYELARRHNLWIVADEVYDELVFEGERFSIGSDDPDERVITVYSFSKTYSMTGWRVGYAVVPESLAETSAKVQEPLISCVNAASQHAAIAALSGPRSVISDMLDSYRLRRDLVIKRLDVAGIPALRPGGAFYVWADISGSGLTARSFARKLVTDDAVAVVPGSAFGDAGDHAVRLSLATDPDDLSVALDRLAHRYGVLANSE